MGKMGFALSGSCDVDVPLKENGLYSMDCTPLYSSLQPVREAEVQRWYPPSAATARSNGRLHETAGISGADTLVTQGKCATHLHDEMKYVLKLLCKKILTWKIDLHRSCRIPQPWTLDLAFTICEDALELWARESARISKIRGVCRGGGLFKGGGFS
jgi:hypothetical protein